MLLGPVEIDFAGAHGFECTLHPERADIDVGQDQGDEQNSDDGMTTCASCMWAMSVP